MSMQPHPQNPIELRKQQVRKDSRNALVSVVAGVGGGAALALLLSSSFFLILGVVLAVAGGAFFGLRVRKALTEDPSSRY